MMLDSRRSVLLLLFGTLYFVQGIVEPTACLPYQPVQSQLRAWDFTAQEIGHFFGVIGVAWSIKPLFGLISDFWPIAGLRRTPYLVFSTGLTAAAFFGLAAFFTAQPAAAAGWFGWLIEARIGQPVVDRIGWLLVLVGIGVAVSDVVIDAVAVETGQPRGITGQIQSVQWFAMSVAGMLAGVGGGFVAQRGLARPMFVVCGLLALVSLAAVLSLVREAPTARAARRPGLRAACQELAAGGRYGSLLAAAAFLFLWNFNPFSSNVLQEYATQQAGFSEQAFGTLLTVQSLGMTVGCVGYFAYCRRVPFGWLVHGSIVAGIASTLVYWLFRDWPTALVASFLFGLTWQTGVLIQLDLCARICPLQSAGTLFALLMAITNTGQSAGIYVGGGWYDSLAAHFDGDRSLAFQALVGIGAACTAACWLLVPLLQRTNAAAR